MLLCNLRTCDYGECGELPLQFIMGVEGWTMFLVASGMAMQQVCSILPLSFLLLILLQDSLVHSSDCFRHV